MWLARVSPAEPTITVAAVSTYAAPELYLSPETERQRAASITEILSSIGGAVDTIVLPESATYLRHTDVQPSLPLLIDAENVQDEKGQSHSVATYVYENGTSAQSAKQFLLPLGEYTPYVYRGLLALFSTEEFRAQVLKTRSFVRGEATTFAHTENLKLAVRFCDEVMSPRLFAGDVQRGADILVNLSSFSWFHGSTRVYDQMQLIAKVRAVESRRAYVQSGNMAATRRGYRDCINFIDAHTVPRSNEHAALN
jgi:apolipoprotein N-acyltransferase